MSSARRDSLRPRPERRARQRPRDDAIILYSVGRTIPRRDRAELELLLDQFHADADLQEMCQLSHSNAVRFMTLETLENHDQRYIARIDVPPGTLLAVYCGSLEKTTAGVQDTLCHSMHMGSLLFPYELFVDGTPQPGDCRPGRMQLVNHACAHITMRNVRSGSAQPLVFRHTFYVAVGHCPGYDRGLRFGSHTRK